MSYLCLGFFSEIVLLFLLLLLFFLFSFKDNFPCHASLTTALKTWNKAVGDILLGETQPPFYSPPKKEEKNEKSPNFCAC